MKKDDVEIRFVEFWKKEDIVSLYKAGGWWGKDDDPDAVNGLIKGSFVFAVAVEGDKAVGMGRVLSDGVSDAYIQDVIVLPEHRGRDIGKRIIVALRDHCLKKGVRWVALVAEKGTDEFYSSLGFKVMEGHTPMRYSGGKE